MCGYGGKVFVSFGLIVVVILLVKSLEGIIFKFEGGLKLFVGEFC